MVRFALLMTLASAPPPGQEDIDAGLAALHDYAFDEARAAFRAARESDRNDAMAVWGEAMTHFRPLWGSVDREAMRGVLAELGSTAAERARKAKNAREAGFLEALEALLGPEDDDQARRAFAGAMENAARRDPEDAEARAWLAHASWGLWPQGLPDGESLERIAALAESVLARDADHPGGLHYLVHALDSPERAWRALPAARRYARVASRDSSHALHMPSHTFLQLGLFDEVIASNEESLAASERSATAHGRSKAWLDFHAIDFLLYARLQKGQWNEARRILEELREIAGEVGSEAAWLPGYVASKTAVYVVETQDWPRLAGPSAEGLYGRDVLVASGLSAIARGERDHAASLVNECRTRRAPAPAPPTGDSIRWEAACDELEGYRLYRRGERAAAIELLRRSVETVSRVPAWETPDPAKPPAELLGEVYLALGDAAEAAVLFRQALARRPGRLRSLHGLARAEPGGAHVDRLRSLLSTADDGVVELFSR